MGAFVTRAVYEPTGATFLVDLITVLLTMAAYLAILAVVLRFTAPAARNPRDAAVALLSLARSLDWDRTRMALAGGVLFLSAIGSAVAYSTSDALHVFVFRLNDERTIPTFYNTMQLFVAATLALLLAYESRGTRRLAWVFFAVGFVAAGIDETGDMHPRFEYYTGLREDFALLPIIALMAASFLVLWPRLRAATPALPLLIVGGILIVVSQAVDAIDAIWSQRILEEVLELSACALFILSMLAVIRFQEGSEPVPEKDEVGGIPESLRYHDQRR